jgi:hypothetical protein
MRAKWDAANQGLSLLTPDGWVYVGWVEQWPEGFLVFGCWIVDLDYPENKWFATEKQAKRALKECATVAVIGGFRGLNS